MRCCDAAGEDAPLKKQKKESRILRAVKRELAEERGKTQTGMASATAAADAAGGLNAPSSPAAQDVQQPHSGSLATAPANGLPTGSTKQAKAELAREARSVSTTADGDAMQGSVTPSAGAKLKKKKRAKNAPAPEREEEQPVMKQKKQGKHGEQKSKKAKGPGPTTGKLLEGAIAMLAARAPQHARR